MELVNRNWARSPLCAAIGFLFVALATATDTTPAKAQSAADLCTPDVMRLCQDHIPDADKIVACLKAKGRQVSSGCRTAMRKTTAAERASYLTTQGTAKNTKKKRRWHRRHRPRR
jgi:hypothetical protein